MVARLSVLLVALSLACASLAQAPFPDVPEDHWAEEAVARLADLGILMGFPDGSFRGNQGITRYEAAMLIDRLLDVATRNAAAATTALEDEVGALRGAVGALVEAVDELRTAAQADRAALEQLWGEVAELRDALGLPPPAPLPPAPELEAPAAGALPDGAGPGARGPEARTPGAPLIPGGEARTPGDGPADPREETAQEAPAGLPDVGGGDAAPGGAAPGDDVAGGAGAQTDPVDAQAQPAPDAPALEVEPDPHVQLDLAFGTTGAPRALLRAGVGLGDVPADRFGIRIGVDLGRRSDTQLGSIAILGHVTYRILEAEPLAAYVGVGAGVQLAGEGPFTGLLAGAAWAVSDPIELFTEATLDAYALRSTPSGAPPVVPGLVMGARLRF